MSTWTWNDLLDSVGGVTQRRRHSALIRLAGFVLDVESDDFALVQDVAKWFAAYDQPSPITAPFDRRIRVVLCLHKGERERLPDPAAMNPTPAGAPSHPLSPLEPGVEVFAHSATVGTERAPVYLVFHHPSATVLLITTSQDSCSAIIARRHVHTLAVYMMLTEGMIRLHAACYVQNGRAVCITGGKRSGKTTMLVSGLAKFKASLLANTSTFVSVEKEGVQVYGLPMAVAVRVSTIRMFEPLHEFLSSSGVAHIADEDLESSDLESGGPKVRVPPHAFAGMLGVTITPRAPLACFVFPRYEPERERAELVRLSPQDAFERLAGQPTRSPFQQNKTYLRALLHRRSCSFESYRQALIPYLAGAVPAYELLHAGTENADTTMLLRTLAQSG